MKKAKENRRYWSKLNVDNLSLECSRCGKKLGTFVFVVEGGDFLCGECLKKEQNIVRG